VVELGWLARVEGPVSPAARGKRRVPQRLAWRPVASSNTGGWVRKVGASGGGRTYRRRRPINYYGVLVLICVLGVASIALARHDYQHPAGASSQGAPTTSDTWFAAYSISTCGETQPALTTNPTAAAAGAVALPKGVIQVHPVKQSQTGSNATLALFVDGYKGLTVSTDELVVPPTGAGTKSTTWTTGTKCPKGTKDAGKPGHVEIGYWKNLSSTVAATATSPTDVRFTRNMLITIGFVPYGAVPPQPPASAIDAMVAAIAPTTTTSTTTTTTAPGATTTTKP
jgi:hypothetical protein